MIDCEIEQNGKVEEGCRSRKDLVFGKTPEVYMRLPMMGGRPWGSYAFAKIHTLANTLKQRPSKAESVVNSGESAKMCPSPVAADGCVLGELHK